MTAANPLAKVAERTAMTRTPQITGLDQTLALADNGQYLPQLLQDNTELIEEIMNFSQAYGAKASGKLQITICYATDRFGQVEIAIEHKVTTPKQPKAKATAWSVEGGGLTVANPNQRAMEIREVGGGHRELRSPTPDN